MTDLPQNLFQIFLKIDDIHKSKEIKMTEDLLIKITECLNTTFYKTAEQMNQQNLLSVYASTASIIKAKYKHDLFVDEFLYVYNKYVNIMEKAVKEMQKGTNGRKVGMG